MTKSHQFTADLHLHTSASDGELTPSEVVNSCKAAGLSTIAITDHDSIAGVAEAQNHGKTVGLEVIAGCEFTGYLDNTELHILGLFIDTSPNSPAVQIIDEVRHLRPMRVLEMTEKLRGLGVRIQNQDVLDETKNSHSPGRAHIAAALVKGGHVKDMNDAFQKFLRPGAPAYLPKVRLDPKRVIDAIHASGGVAILAHPAQYRRDDLVALLFGMGLDGLEIYHHSHNPGEEDKYARIAQAHGGLTSGGSDYHGPRMKPGIEVRSAGATAEMLAALKNKANLKP